MRVLVLGATGSIGSNIVSELKRCDHSIVALARSDASEQRLNEQDIDVVRGDLRHPGDWVTVIHEVEAVIHAAATFTDDMGVVDRQLVEALIEEAGKGPGIKKFIYTGGVWLYGDTNNAVVDEDSDFNPISAFSWMLDNADLLMRAPCFSTSIIHPAMVYDEEGGVFTRFFYSARNSGQIEVWGSIETRWPLVHGQDLATAYRLVLEGGKGGEQYNVAAEAGVPVANIVDAISKKLRLETSAWVRPIYDVVRQHGAWAVGPALDQQMSSDKIRNTLNWDPQKKDVIVEIS